MNMIKLSVLKNRLSGILSVVGIPPVPIPEEIQLLIYVYTFMPFNGIEFCSLDRNIKINYFKK